MLGQRCGHDRGRDTAIAVSDSLRAPVRSVMAIAPLDSCWASGTNGTGPNWSHCTMLNPP